MKADLASRFSVRSARKFHSQAVGKLPRVTIRRELRHFDQIIKLEHGGTDRRRKFNAVMRGYARGSWSSRTELSSDVEEVMAAF